MDFSSVYDGLLVVGIAAIITFYLLDMMTNCVCPACCEARFREVVPLKKATA